MPCTANRRAGRAQTLTEVIVHEAGKKVEEETSQVGFPPWRRHAGSMNSAWRRMRRGYVSFNLSSAIIAMNSGVRPSLWLRVADMSGRGRHPAYYASFPWAWASWVPSVFHRHDNVANVSVACASGA